MSTVQITSIPCVHLPVTDVERAITWWQENFGLEFGWPYEKGSGMAELRTENGQWIFLFEVKEIRNNNRYTKGALPNSDDDQLFSFTMNAKDVTALYHTLREKGVKVGRLEERGGGHAFDCYDPDHNKFNIWGGEWKE
ncbi:VOC family protein [Brevibacillus migulae]|uniref:VOC family protein n=1 Tax=Brevibacillus migulae TaxID=1644114 RepID=UPI00106E0C82|nr:VOC family protein [Brevibacillus migulae]